MLRARKRKDAQITAQAQNTVLAMVIDAIVCQDGKVLIVVSAQKLIAQWDAVDMVFAK